VKTVNDLRRALDQEMIRLEPAPGLEARILHQALRSPSAQTPGAPAGQPRATRPWEPKTFEAPRLMALVAILLAIAIVAALVGLRALHSSAPTPSTQRPTPTLHRNGPVVVGGNGDLTAIDPVTGAQSTIASISAHGQVSDLAYSADGARLAYLLGSAETGGGEVWVLDTKTLRTHLLTTCRCAKLSHLSWSPDGSQLAFVDGSQLYLIGADGTKRTQLTHLPTGQSATQPTWSPDGIRIAFKTQSRIDVIRTDGSGLAVLLTDANEPWDPAWSPDGSRIAYVLDPVSSHGFDYQLWLMDSDGSHRIQIFVSPGCCVTAWGGPAWSPDATQIAVVAYPIPGWYLWVVNADGSDPRNLGKVKAIDRPAWEPLP
jgi:Tol biopolymer transport system component